VTHCPFSSDAVVVVTATAVSEELTHCVAAFVMHVPSTFLPLLASSNAIATANLFVASKHCFAVSTTHCPFGSLKKPVAATGLVTSATAGGEASLFQHLAAVAVV